MLLMFENEESLANILTKKEWKKEISFSSFSSKKERKKDWAAHNVKALKIYKKELWNEEEDIKKDQQKDSKSS